MKQCGECKIVYKNTYFAFYKNKANADGLDRRCIICDREHQNQRQRDGKRKKRKK
jgi:hypothetical protein